MIELQQIQPTGCIVIVDECIVIGDECVGQAWWNYVCQYSAGVYLQCSYQQVFIVYYKNVFSQFSLGGWVMK